MIKLYYYKFSRASRVRWALEEVGAQYELVQRGDNMFGGMDYAKIHPLKKIPAITDDGVPVFETAAICLYLADKFKKLAPPATDLAVRGQYYQWMFFGMTELDRMAERVFRQFKGLTPEVKNAEAEAIVRTEFQARAKVVSDHLKGRTYMVGNEFTMADLLGVYLGMGRKHEADGRFSRFGGIPKTNGRPSRVSPLES